MLSKLEEMINRLFPMEYSLASDAPFQIKIHLWMLM